MSTPKVNVTVLDKPITAVGRVFHGDYSKSPQYVTEVQNELRKAGIGVVPNRVLGVYYDNPSEKPADELSSFQGVFLTDDNGGIVPPSLSKLTMQGKYLHVAVAGDPQKVIQEGYMALFGHIQQQHVALKSTAGYQISSCDDGLLSFDIYMEIG